MAPFGVQLALDAFRRKAVDHAQNTPPLRSLGHNHLHRIRRRAENRTNLRRIANPIQDIDREPIAQRNHKQMPRRDSRRILGSQAFQFFVVPVHAGQTRSRRLIKGDAKFHLWNRVHNRFVQIFNGLDEVTVTNNEIPALRNN